MRAKLHSLLTLTLSALVTPLQAQVAPGAQETPAVEGQAARPDRGRETVLLLEGGGVLRMRARQVDGSWEVRGKDGWRALPPGSVLRATPEAELLRRARALAREVDEDDPVRRVAYATWLVDQGLLAEALAQLDRVLADDPDQEDACVLLTRQHALSVWMAGWLPAAEDSQSGRELRAVAARSGPAAMEFAVTRLAAATEIPELREELLAELLGPDPLQRAFATLALRRVLPGKEIRPLLGRAVLDTSHEVRRGAGLALRAVEDPAVIIPVVRALGSARPRVRQNAIAALETMGYGAAVRPLYGHLLALQSGAVAGPPHSHIAVGRQIAYVQDFDVEVAAGQAIADPVINVVSEGVVLDAAVLGVNEYVIQTERAAVRRALGQLTGANPGRTTKAWKTWWIEHGGEWQAESPPRPPSSPSRREG